MKKFVVFLCAILITAGCYRHEEKKQVEQVSGQAAPVLKKGSKRDTPVVDAVRMIEDSVVNIRTEKIVKSAVKDHDKNLHGEHYDDDFLGNNRPYKTQSLGSGFIVKDDGTIITNYHVIASASKIYVMLSDNTTYEAQLVGGDNIIDIAVLKIKHPDRKFPVVKTGDSDKTMLGETVIAMGNPYGLNSSITTGVISSVRRILHIGLGYSVFLQTDALINPGNSGGPLVNLDGEVIGINSAVVQQAQGIGFTIPINTALRVMPEILKYHRIKTGYMGISAQEIKDSDGVHLRVVNVDKGSNADKIGIKPGDIILQVNGIPVSSLIAMSNMLRSYPAGSSIALIVERGKKTLKGRVLLTGYPEGYGLSLLMADYGFNFAEKDGALTMTASNMPDLFKPGDILLSIDNKKITSLNQLSSCIMDNLGRQIVLKLNRHGKNFLIKIQI